MAFPSLKKMGEGGTQEGIYASSNASYIGEVDRTDLGLTLLPGSQIQREQSDPRLDKVRHGRECLRELNNGSKKGIASSSGECALGGKVHQDVCSQEKIQDPVEIEPEGNTGSNRHETTCVPDSSCINTADRSGEGARIEPHKASVVSNDPARSRSRDWNDLNVVQTCAYTVNVPVSEVLSSAVGEINESRAREPVHGLIHSVEGESVALVNDSRSSESGAEESLDGLRPYKRQKTEEYLPCSLFHDLQDALVEQLDLGGDLWKRGLSDEDVGVISKAVSGVLRSHSHSPANDVVRVVNGTGSEPHYQPPRLASAPAFETRSRSLSTTRSSGISSGHSIPPSARPERSYTPLSTPPRTSRATSIPGLSTENRATSRQPQEKPNVTASSAPIANLWETSQRSGSFIPHPRPEIALNEGSPLLETLPSATALPPHDHLEPERFPCASVTISSLSKLPTQQSTLVEAIHTASVSTISSAQSPFTDCFDKFNNNSIHYDTSLDNTAKSTTTPGDVQLLETLPYRIGPLPSKDAYESPYAPKSRRWQHLLNSQTKERNTLPKTGYLDPMEHSTPELAITEAAATPPSGSQHPHTATLIPSTTSSSGPISPPMPALQSEPSLSMPSLPVPSEGSALTTESPDRASSEECSSESDETSSESSSEESAAPTERITIPPALVNAAKKGLHAITSVIVSRIHHDDIVPRVISFIKTFPTSSDTPAPPNEACPADNMDLLYKNHSLYLRNHSLLERNAILQRERDRFKRAAREWATTDPESGLTKGQSMSREVRSLRRQLAKERAEVERLRTAWVDFEASRVTAYQWNYRSAMFSGGPPSRANGNWHEPRVDVVWQDTEAVSSGYGSHPFPTAEPTPPVSKRVSIDLTEGTPEPSWTLATPQPAPPRPLPSSPAVAALRSTMKRKTYSWLPDKSNHMVKKPRPAARGSQPSTAIELDVEGPAFDPDAELEAELERELLASRHAEDMERGRRQAAWQRRQKMTPKEKVAKDRRAKAATRAARTGRVEEERERLMVEDQQRAEDEQRQREAEEMARDEALFGVEGEQQRKEVEERTWDEELFGMETEQQRKEAEERTRDEGLFGVDEEEPKEMVDVQVGAEGGWDEAAELALHRAIEESSEESEEE